MENNFFENLFKGSTRINQRNKKYIIKKINSDVVFKKSEETYLDEEGPRTEQSATVYQADCGHFVGFSSPNELIAQCNKCGKYLCHRCGNLRCRRCLDVLCSSCAKLVDEITIYCSKCRIIRLLKRGSLFSLKGFHQLMSKEIK